jgi:O-antigen/teichoic acid export membrane protein
MSNSENNKRIAKNTLLLYGRTLITLIISLYTSRIILNVLGVENFGIYNVVGGIIGMFGLISGSLASTTQRFLNFESGKKNAAKLKQIFSTAILIYAILAVIALILGESVGLWFLNTQMNIAPERIVAANWVYQCAIITFCVNLISLPYIAAIVAHEKMSVFAYISILEAILKLIIVFLLQWILFDKLISYALLMLFFAIIIRMIFARYCRKHFQECSFIFCKDKALYKEMTSFAGWSFFGNSSGVLMGYGVNILINIFYGLTLNAARGIVDQVQYAIKTLVSNIIGAMSPQITKSYASGEREYMISLLKQGSKFSFYLFLILSLPVMIETKTILALWLKIVPDYTIIFIRLALIYSLLQTLSYTLEPSASATGKIKKYQLIVGGIQSLVFPLSFLFLYLKFEPQITYIITLFLACFSLMASLWLLRGLIGLSVRYYIKQVILNVSMVSILSCILPYWVSNSMNEGVVRLICVTLVSIISSSLIIYVIGLNDKERKFISSLLILRKNIKNK